MLKNHEFAVVIENCDLEDDNFLDTLFEAGCNDCLPVRMNGVNKLHFDRDGENLTDAITSALQNIKSAGAEAVLIEIDPSTF